MLPHAFRVTTGPVTKFAGPQSTKGTLMRRAALFLLVGVLAGCGDDGGNTPTSPAPAPTTTRQPRPVPAPRRPADISLTGEYECTTSFCDYAVFSLSLTNTGGVGANLNFIRGENRNFEPIWEFGADHFVNALGHNRLAAGGGIDLGFRAQLGFYIAIGYTDDLRNRGVARFYTDPPR